SLGLVTQLCWGRDGESWDLPVATGSRPSPLHLLPIAPAAASLLFTFSPSPRVLVMFSSPRAAGVSPWSWLAALSTSSRAAAASPSPRAAALSLAPGNKSAPLPASSVPTSLRKIWLPPPICKRAN
ncbi:unnamed protein product, partial [Urochloa humidicola]